jgi:5-hydroxyisourate hydrolase
MAGKLSTHVLDTCHGLPAAGVGIELWDYTSGQVPKLIARAMTNADGRTDAPLLTGEDFYAATFELRFQVGAYFRKQAVAPTEPAFLEEVPVRFTVADATKNYHVPLLVSPWAYSTYRGS